jgi:hypothetical protein
VLLGFNTSIHAADAPIVREVYVCNYLDGKDMDDLMRVRDYFVSRFDDIGLTDETHFVWTPFKANVDFDLLWFVDHTDMLDFARDADKFDSDAGRAVQARFDQVISCTSSIALRREIFASGEIDGEPPALISSFACSTREGVDDTALNDLWGHVNGVLGDMETSSMLLFASEPIIGSNNAPDLYLYSVENSVEDWATSQTALRNSAAGQQLGRHFNAVLDCTNSLWWGHPVIPVPE